MKFRNTGGENEKCDPQMAPMIDVVFQLLIFFMLTLKIIEPEGDFSINMPQGKPDPVRAQDIVIEPKFVVMNARPDGTLAKLQFGGRSFPLIPATDDEQIDAYLKNNAIEGLKPHEAATRIGEIAAFKKLNFAVAEWVDQQRKFLKLQDNKADAEQFEKELRIKLQFPYQLNSRYIIKATSACRQQQLDGEDQPRTLVKTIEFIRPTRPEKP